MAELARLVAGQPSSSMPTAASVGALAQFNIEKNARRPDRRQLTSLLEEGRGAGSYSECWRGPSYGSLSIIFLANTPTPHLASRARREVKATQLLAHRWPDTRLIQKR